MFSKIILTALSIAAVAIAAPVEGAAERVPAIVTMCSAGLVPRGGCVDIPVVSDTCINFTGGLSFLNDEVSTARVPGGFVCTIFQSFSCINDGQNQNDVAVLTGGDWNMFNVQGIRGAQNFNDLTSSFSCSPI